jgi:diaminohydroxyphosphoribosylaminopyrimidine deaminase/5-amino-6-(5-phosphoribosylamino)uracil reductase
MTADEAVMRHAIRLAKRAFGETSPNPIVGALLKKNGQIIGRGWHRRAGFPHAEIEAIQNAKAGGHSVRGATLYVTLEPCSSFGRTPPCTQAIIKTGIKKVVVGATDPNLKHAGSGMRILKRAGISVISGILEEDCRGLNPAFNQWIINQTPLVTVKAAMTLDGKIATKTGESKWITSERSRSFAMNFRRAADAILVGVNTIIADDPSLTVRGGKLKQLRRIILDSKARIPLKSTVLTDKAASLTTVVVTKSAPPSRVTAIKSRTNVLVSPDKKGGVDLKWLLKRLGAENVTNLLVEGGGEVNASFILGGLAHRIAFFYAPKIIGGKDARPAVAGLGAASVADILKLTHCHWKRLGPDLLLRASF